MTKIIWRLASIKTVLSFSSALQSKIPILVKHFALPIDTKQDRACALSRAGWLKLEFKLLADRVFRSCFQVISCQFYLLAMWQDL